MMSTLESERKICIVVTCPVCFQRHKITIDRESIAEQPDKILRIVIDHTDIRPAHKINLYVDIYGHVRRLNIDYPKVKESVEYKFKVTIEEYPLLVNPKRARKIRDPVIRKIIDLSNGFTSIREISKILKISKFKILTIIGKLKAKRIIDVIYTISVATYE